MWQNGSWLITVLSKSIWKFTLVWSSWWGISLSINGPKRSSWNNSFFISEVIDNNFIWRFPVPTWLNILSYCLTSSCEGHWSIGTFFHFTFKTMRFCKLFISSELWTIIELRVVDEFITDHGISTLCWYLIVTKMNIFVLVLIINWLESTIVAQNYTSLWFFLSCIFVVITIQLSLPWFHSWIWFVTIWFVTCITCDVIDHIWF